MFGNICRTFLLKLKLFQHRMYLKVYLVRCFRRGYDSELHFFFLFLDFFIESKCERWSIYICRAIELFLFLVQFYYILFISFCDNKFFCHSKDTLKVNKTIMWAKVAR